ncbi:sugar ABC transporter substrate-binding protein [Roseococcus sp. DSY-14]|uniref:sugar ABC transporter substrate-binding protein n=1 Tax=Roseococcus sp. DSY-14 TaxID=3369650 RepID=UPI00387B3DF0
MSAALRLAVFTKNRSNPAYEAARIGAERAAARLGATLRHYVPETPDDADQQIALVHAALAERPDALVFTAVHQTRLEPALDAVRAAGIPVFSFVGRLAPGRAVSHVGADDAALAADVARRLFAQLGGAGQVAILEGPPGAVTNTDRLRGIAAALAEFPGIAVAGRATGLNLRGPGRAAMAALLPRLPRLDAVLAVNDAMALGALEALDEAGRRATIAGINAIPEAIRAIQAGRMLVTADFNAMALCHLATECAIRHGRGEAVPEEIELPVALVDAANCAAWDLPYEDRPLPTLAEALSSAASSTPRPA